MGRKKIPAGIPGPGPATQQYYRRERSVSSSSELDLSANHSSFLEPLTTVISTFFVKPVSAFLTKPSNVSLTEPSNASFIEPSNDPLIESLNDPFTEPLNNPSAESLNNSSVEPLNDPSAESLNNPFTKSSDALSEDPEDEAAEASNNEKSKHERTQKTSRKRKRETTDTIPVQKVMPNRRIRLIRSWRIQEKEWEASCAKYLHENPDKTRHDFMQIKSRPTLNNSRAIPGSEALTEIKYYQRSTDLILPKATFQRVCREISTKISPSLRWQCSALEALQVAGEEIIVTLFECGVLAMIHRKRVTFNCDDICLVKTIIQKGGIKLFSEVNS